MSVVNQYAEVEEEVRFAAQKAGVSVDLLTLVAVSKRQPVERIQELLSELNRQDRSVVLGENYVQEFKKKRELLQGTYKSHLIGPLQSNKVRDAVRLFDVIQSVQSEKILHAINKEALKEGKRQQIFLQINISDDSNKSGLSESECMAALQECQSLQGVHLVGLMTITRFYSEPELVREEFQHMKALADRASAQVGYNLQLSMGMSADFAIAIEEGATVVRVGTAIFGERS